MPVLHHVSKVIVHPLTVRTTHWVNALAMIIMIMSGWRVYNSEPIFSVLRTFPAGVLPGRPGGRTAHADAVIT